MKLRIILVLLAYLLAGCSTTMNVTLMQRDSGNVHRGFLNGDGSGSGSMSVDFGERNCSGPAARASSNETFEVASVYGTTNRGNNVSGTATSFKAGDTTVKALLSCSDGKGLRCELTGRNLSGTGICVDDSGKVFDVVVTRK